MPAPVTGETQEFDLIALSSDPAQPSGRRTARATLRAISEHAYVFVEDSADIGDGEVDDAVRAFEEDVWPDVTGAFGPPPVPGIDGDPRIALVHADLGPALGGYVSSEDAYPRAAVPHSNQREIVYMNLRRRPLGSAGYASTLAHEFQHLIHERLDPGEDAWVNEGLSEFSASLVGGPGAITGGSSAFLDKPDLQLDTWASGAESGAHYVASGLFAAYLVEQGGGDVRAFASDSADGADGVRSFLQATGDRRSFGQLVADWAVANLIDKPDGPHGYSELQVGPASTDDVSAAGQHEGEVHQFGADYLELNADEFANGSVFHFEGDTQTPVLAVAAEAGGALWWANRGDSIDTTLTREIDLTDVGEATLTFRTWYDIERWFDFAHVAASRDDGRTWQALAGEHTTTDDPLGVSYGPGYSGSSSGWVDERIDLSTYAGAPVLLRFEYVTDDSFSGPGWAIDDIAVPEAGFFDDGASDAGGWQRAGFLRVTAPLQQRYELRLVTLGDAPEVTVIPLDAQNRADVPLGGLGSAYQRAVVVVVGATEGTTVPGGYRYEVVPA